MDAPAHRVAVVTCSYTRLHGTPFGGRAHVEHRYTRSLLSLLKMRSADFHVFCDPAERSTLAGHVAGHAHVNLVPFDLHAFPMRDLFDRHKDRERAARSDRCQEIQYGKAWWMKQVAESGAYTHVFWFDVGISYSGLIPDVHLLRTPDGPPEYFDSGLFTDTLLHGLVRFTGPRFFMMCIHNREPQVYRHPAPSVPAGPDQRHAIAGILGGTCAAVSRFHAAFVEQAEAVAHDTGRIHDEEVIYNVMRARTPGLFAEKHFDLWWHPDNIRGHFQDDATPAAWLARYKSFYRVLEELNAEGAVSAPGRS